MTFSLFSAVYSSISDYQIDISSCLFLLRSDAKGSKVALELVSPSSQQRLVNIGENDGADSAAICMNGIQDKREQWECEKNVRYTR